MTSSTHLASLIRYWRKTLSDEDIAGIKLDQNRPHCPAGEIYQGALPFPMRETLKKEWRNHLGKQQKGSSSGAAGEQTRTDEDAMSVPVVLLARAYGPSHEHGRAVGGQSSDALHFTLQIPAIMQPSGDLVAHPNMTPWVVRRYMRPNHDNESLPIVADITAFDQYISANPLAVQGFREVLQWCDDLWQSITDGQTPEGFVEVDRIYAVIADGVQGASQNLCRLYDALEMEQETPLLFARICNGTGQPNVVDTPLRISALSSPRGTMSTAYGLADSQSDAVAALVSIGNEANILAVNGPPGTGKTTLLQSVIATLVVSRAIAGGDPAVIVGSSTNNQAVTNILKSMNDILKENPSSGKFPWSKRWVPDAETYGMYLPSNQSKTSAEFAFALKNGQEWSGFSERENNPDYIQGAKTLWLQSYQETYGSDPLNMESGLALIQADIRNLAKAAERCAPVWTSWLEAAEWWRNIAGNEPPDIYICRARSSIEQEIQEKTEGLDRAIADRSRADHDHQAAAAEAERDKALGIGKVNQRKAAIDLLRHLKLAVNKAMLPQGAVENFCYFSVIFRSMFHQRKAVRLDTIRNDPEFQVAFSRMTFPEDQDLWVGYIDAKIGALSKSLEMDVAACNQVIRDSQAHVDTKLHHLESANAAVTVAQKHLEDAKRLGAERVSHLDARITALSNTKKSLYSTYAELCQRAESEFGISVEPLREGYDLEIVDFDAVLDRTIRHACFQKAMRYWEGRWILAAERLLIDEQMKRGGLLATESRFRRWCMLTPCLVSTAHSLPKHFQYTKPVKDTAGKTIKDEAGKSQFEHPFLWSYIDLLIVDEAGQVGPHIGAGIFSLAKQSVVVGDIYQIEPVATGSPGTDHANAAHEGLAHHWENGTPTTPHMVSEPASGGTQGSIMRLAQGATPYVSSGTEAEPGIFLREHRRCRAEIISYCNELIYGGRLQPLSGPRKVEPPVRPMAYAHVRGEEVRAGGSRSNPLEAKAIAQWIMRNKDAWIVHYGKTIEEIVAVVTPFKTQAFELQKALMSADRSLAKVTAGTVHSLQGAERQIVVFSPVYQLENAKGLFFDRKPNMMNVAVSRAKDSFVVIGDVRIFDGNGNAPSALLGKYLFADEENELPDVNVNVRFLDPVIRAAKRLSGVEAHQEFLRKAFAEANPGEFIVISSPWVKAWAMKTDRVLENAQSSIQRSGVKVFILVNINNLNSDEKKLVEALRNSGVTVFSEERLHSKVFIRGRGEIVEGSFNWLSAVRDQNNKWANYESSLWLSGDDAREAIRLALDDFKRVYNRDIPIPLMK